MAAETPYTDKTMMRIQSRLSVVLLGLLMTTIIYFNPENAWVGPAYFVFLLGLDASIWVLAWKLKRMANKWEK